MRFDEAKLAERLEGLLRRSDELRSRIADDATSITARLRVIDQATAFLRSGGGRVVVVGGILLLLLSGPGRVFKIAGRTALAWSLVRRWLPHALALRRGSDRA
jgi:hypothetical protein